MVWHEAMAADDQVSGPARPRRRTVAVATGSAAAVVVALGMIAFGGAALAGVPAVTTTVTPSPTEFDGNVRSGHCEDAFPGSIVLFEGAGDSAASGPAGNGSVTGGILTVTINAGFVAVGIAVKGGPTTNLYPGPFVGPIVVTGMVPPDNDQDPDQNPQGFSHWMVCGEEDDTTPTTSKTRTTTTTTTVTTVTTVPGTTTTPGLPTTGASLGGLIAAGVALVAGGATLLFLRRRREATDTGAES